MMDLEYRPSDVMDLRLIKQFTLSVLSVWSVVESLPRPDEECLIHRPVVFPRLLVDSLPGQSKECLIHGPANPAESAEDSEPVHEAPPPRSCPIDL